jgi:hypothetical protein
VLTISLRSQKDTVAFCAFLRAVQVAVVELEGTTVSASVPGAHSELHERRELVGYVVTWNALHPGQIATLAS